MRFFGCQVVVILVTTTLCIRVLCCGSLHGVARVRFVCCCSLARIRATSSALATYFMEMFASARLLKSPLDNIANRPYTNSLYTKEYSPH